MRIAPKKKSETSDNIFWTTMTDLMTALTLVFMLLFFYMCTQAHIKEIRENAEQQKTTKELKEVLDKNNIKAEVQGKDGIVQISDLELFQLNSYELSPKGMAYLDKFAPAYFESFLSNDYFNENLDKIIIRGHTDSQMYVGDYTKQEQYMKNMELSIKRAYAVADYMLKTNYDKKYENKVSTLVLVEGASFSEPILDSEGKEDFDKSRRVELKIVMKSKRPSQKVGENEVQKDETVKEVQPESSDDKLE